MLIREEAIESIAQVIRQNPNDEAAWRAEKNRLFATNVEYSEAITRAKAALASGESAT